MNRDEAVQWCVENVEKWPEHGEITRIEAPAGWCWFGFPGDQLDLRDGKRGFVTHGCWTRAIESQGVMHQEAPNDPVNNPAHYTSHPSGIECIDVTEHMNFNRGNAVKYIWRAGDKGCEVEDLQKARWYIDREIKRLEGRS